MLTRREEFVLAMLNEGLTCEEIGKLLGVREDRVRRIYSRAVKKLQGLLQKVRGSEEWAGKREQGVGHLNIEL